MTDTVTDRLRAFTCRLLERRGALVEWDAPADAGMALLPGPLAQTLGCDETLALVTRQDGAAQSRALCTSLANDFLDRMQPLVDAEPAVAAFRVPNGYLKKGGLDEAVKRSFSWLNARVTYKGAMAVRTQYEVWYFLAGLRSEEPWEELVRVEINASSGAQVSLPAPQELEGLTPTAKLDPVALERGFASASRHAAGMVERQAARFLDRLSARRERDRTRLRSYYNALLAPVRRRSAQPEDPEAAKARRRAVELELRRKLDELDERYALQASLTPVAVVCLDVQALAIQCLVQRKAAKAMHTVWWNPLSKSIEPLACSSCGATTFGVAFTDQTVQALCPACAQQH